MVKQAPHLEEIFLANMLVEKLLSSKWTSPPEAVIKTRDGTIQVHEMHSCLLYNVYIVELKGLWALISGVYRQFF